MRLLKRLLVTLLAIAVIGICLCYFYLYPRYTVPILTYHFIDYHKTSTLYVTPENFTKQLKYLYDRKYNIITLDELVEGIKEGRKFRHNTVCITFDDGYEDNFVNGFPILYKYKFPAIIFLITGFVDKEKFLKWDQVRLMAENNIEFGGHTRTDMYLPEAKNKEKLWGEIAGCKKDIEEKLGKRIDYFCYPLGAFNEEVKSVVKEAGYKGACTTNRGYVKYNRDIYELKRIKVTNSDTNDFLSFKLKLSGYYNLFRRTKRPE